MDDDRENAGCRAGPGRDGNLGAQPEGKGHRRVVLRCALALLEEQNLLRMSQVLGDEFGLGAPGLHLPFEPIEGRAERPAID